MTAPSSARDEFRQWVDGKADPGWAQMPLTHIAKAITARDIIATGRLEPRHCTTLKDDLTYCFYGRAAYRVSGDGKIKQESISPLCFIFSPNLMNRAKGIHAFDTGAHGRRMFSHILAEEHLVSDFSLERDISRPNKLIAATFGTKEAYFDGNTSAIPKPETISENWEFQTRAYLYLITSPGRNEIDDRVYTVELNFADPITLSEHLQAVVVPHTIWDGSSKAPWLDALTKSGVDICTYPYFPARGAEFYQGQVERAVKDYFKSRGVL